MRCILTGCLAVTVATAVVVRAQEPARRSGPANPMSQPAVTLGPPTVSLGAPRPMAVTPGGDIAPCGFGLLVSAKPDDKAPMPPGPTLPATPGTVPSPLGAPTPIPPPEPIAAPAGSGPVTSGPIISDTVVPGPLSAGPGPNVTADPCWAPLPGGAFCGDCRPCGYILYGNVEALFW